MLRRDYSFGLLPRQRKFPNRNELGQETFAQRSTVSLARSREMLYHNRRQTTLLVNCNRNCSASWRLANEFAATLAKSACADWISVAEGRLRNGRRGFNRRQQAG